MMETSELIITVCLVSTLFEVSLALPLVKPPAPMPALWPPPPGAKPPRAQPPKPRPPASRPPPPAPKPQPPVPVPPKAPLHVPPPPKALPPPPLPPTAACPIDTMKLGACVEILGGLIHIHIGDPAIGQCCPMLGGLLGLEAAMCMCSTFCMKMMNLTIFMPVAIELIGMCGMSIPPGYKCDISSRIHSNASRYC
ncbi:unnamed protein product [Cuscuta campestris]|uniref:Hydrophobic seed protein domain-containing protein n=1 Tax=Cuscuta campestris TaxID=132261 RepID=A0A484KEU8_9ASTE|nr:unnamed protein product [Cuscuta campestris]